MKRVVRGVALGAVAALALLGASGCGGGSGGSGEPAGSTSASGSGGSGEPAGSTSASEAKSTIPVLNVPLPSGIDTLDATKANAGRLLSQIGLETLMNYTPSGELKPWLAKSVTRKSPTRYVYDLRQGVKFWNGNELTSADVVNSLNYQARPGSQVAYGYTSVKSIKADGQYKVVVNLTRPDPNWPYVSAQNMALIWEKKFQDEHKSTFGQPGTLVMGTGPWKFESFDPTTGAQLAANANWWNGKAPIDQIKVSFFNDQNGMARAMAAGEIDIVPPGAGGTGTATPIGNPPAFESVASNATVVKSQTCTIYFVTMNVAQKPWDDVHVRRAVAYGLNASDLVKANFGYGAPLSTILTNDMLGLIGSKEEVQSLVDSLPQYPTSVEKAKAELAQSGYPNGFKTTFEVPTFDNLPLIAQAVAGQLKPIGIDASVRVVPNAKFLSEIFGPPDARPSTVWDFGCVGPDPNALDLLVGKSNQKTGGLNFANYSKPEIDQLLAEGAASTDPAERRTIYQKILTITGQDVPYAPFLNGAYVAAVSDKYTFSVNPYSYFNGTWALDVKPR